MLKRAAVKSTGVKYFSKRNIYWGQGASEFWYHYSVKGFHWVLLGNRDANTGYDPVLLQQGRLPWGIRCLHCSSVLVTLGN